ETARLRGAGCEGSNCSVMKKLLAVLGILTVASLLVIGQGPQKFGALDVSNVWTAFQSFVSSSIQDLTTKLFPVIDVRAHGAVGDAVTLTGCSAVSGNANVTCTSSHGKTFTPDAVGKTIGVSGGDSTAADPYHTLITTITAYVSPTTVTLA